MTTPKIHLSSTDSAFKKKSGAIKKQRELEKQGIKTELLHVGDEASETHVLVEVEQEEKPFTGTFEDTVDDLIPPSSDLEKIAQEQTEQVEEPERRPPRIKRERKRIPLGSQGPLFIADKYKDPNYVERYVNDKPGRIDAFQRAGWEMVCLKENRVVGDPHCGKGTKVGTPVTVHVGGNEYAYLMRIKKEWYDEDQKRKKERLINWEDQVKQEPTKEGYYGKIEF